MIHRAVSPVIFSSEFGRQMRFIAGARQSGKTTLARYFLKEKGCAAFYYNWDDPAVRRRYRIDPQFIWTDMQAQRKKRSPYWVCFDEIHKMPKWKNILKGIFDTSEEKFRLIITGSARLDYFRCSGDSLAGRYFLFHLWPFSMFELTRQKSQELMPKKDPFQFVEDRLGSVKYCQDVMESLIKWTGFPEPFLKASMRFHRKWHQDYQERLVREDIRDLTLVRDLENIVTLLQLLPSRIGSPLSLNALRMDLEVSHTAIRNYVKAMELTYILFPLLPYSKRIQRAIRKERKVYFYDWSSIVDPGARFENFIACELLYWVTSWNDAGLGPFELRYVRTRLGKETDFLVLWNQKPWLLLEGKLTDQQIERHHLELAHMLGGIPVIQLVSKSGIARKTGKNGFVVSASRFLAG